jgi:hypothetical protein
MSNLLSQIPAGAFINKILDERRAVLLGIPGVGVAALLLGVKAAKPAVYLAFAVQGVGELVDRPRSRDQPGAGSVASWQAHLAPRQRRLDWP